MPKKILVADSSITIQKVFSFTFKGPDYTVTAVGDATAALAKAREITPDLIVVDLSLPQKNGYEVFQEIRRNPALQKAVGLILLSAQETFNADKARPGGVSDFLVKPFDTQALTNKVRELLSRPPKAAEPVLDARNLPPLSMQDEPSLIRFTRSTLTAKPKEPEQVKAPAPVMSEDVQVVDQDLEPEPVDFAEVESLEPAAELEPAAAEEPELDSLEQVDLEPAELEEKNPEESVETVEELEEIVLDDELARETEPESAELEPAELEPAELELAEPETAELEPLEAEPIEMEPLEPVSGGGADEIVFDVVEDSSASNFEAKPKKPAAPAGPDLSALDDLPLAETEEIEELPEMEETPPLEELGSESASEVLEEVPPEIPYAGAVEEELSLGDGPPEADAEEPEVEALELAPGKEMEETELPEMAAGGQGQEPGREAAPETESLAMEQDQEPVPVEEDLPAEAPSSLQDQMPEEDFIPVAEAMEEPHAPAPGKPGPPAPAVRPEDVSRLAGETIEKVAWEVIPDLVDKLVREMVRESIEKVAWEVIPDLAERLIQEEIKRLEAQAGQE